MIEMSFSNKILHWYSHNKRSLPWRLTKDPYKIWLSEIMLQQTRVAQGLPYYFKFIAEYPTVKDLANAKEEEVLKLWQGLGYYSRARNLHATAIKVSRDFKGEFPNTYKGLLQLKGIGDYTASAIASSSFNLPEAVVDGNVYRVLARYYGVYLPINSTEGIKYFKALAKQVMDASNIRDYNQGIMEFGAMHCTPKKPKCEICPLNDGCVALKENTVKALPHKLKKGQIKKRFFNYLILLDAENYTKLEKRSGKGIWQNLFQFPLIETDKEIDQSQLKKKISKVLEFEHIKRISRLNKKIIVHKLSHQHLYTQFWLVKTNCKIEAGIPPSELVHYPVPVLIADAIKTLKFSYF